jgi:DNA-binding response OmpR family regulator
MLHHFCPNCGWDVARDQPILINNFSMFGDGHPLHYMGKQIKLTPGESAICWSLMKCYPNFVSPDTLLIRSNSDADTRNTISVLIHRIRRKIIGVAGVDPIENIRGRGYQWNVHV